MMKSNFLPGLKNKVLLKDYTSFRIGGKARYFFAAKNKTDAIEAILAAKKLKLPFFILGGGSNILVSDKGFKGLIIKFEMGDCKLSGKDIFCQAGVPLSKLVGISIKNNLSGLEWAIGVPGTVGGAIYGNAGAFGNSMSVSVKEVEVFDVTKEQIKIFKNKDCRFSYRNSFFKKNKNFVILSAEIKMKKGRAGEIAEKMKEYSDHRKNTQPLNFFSAGSVFENPAGFSAGELIEKCGLKGRKIGKAKISEKHANFIVNTGGAKSADVEKLIALIKKEVKKKFKIELKEETQHL